MIKETPVCRRTFDDECAETLRWAVCASWHKHRWLTPADFANGRIICGGAYMTFQERWDFLEPHVLHLEEISRITRQVRTIAGQEVVGWICLPQKLWEREQRPASSDLKLTPEDQALLKKFGREAQLEQRALWYEAEAKALEKMKEVGTDIVTSVDKAPFRDAVKPVWDKYGAKYAEMTKRIAAVS